jgi:NAD(P)-dependent dehydrogenase (short-subunit alcohol dehydrogenase family)
MEKRKSIFITGVSGGIGNSIASYFKKNNFEVIGLDITPPKDPNTVDTFIQIDLNLYCTNDKYRGEKNSILLEKVNSLDVLVNNAAVQLLDHLKDIEVSDWQTSLNVNLTAPLLLSQLFLEKLEKRQGSIINIGSIHQQLTKPRFLSYATSKSALIGMTKAMAVDLQNKVRVNAISPAAIETDMLRAGFDNDENAIDKLREIHPVNKIGNPSDVASLVFFLASQNKSFIHGANIQMDGGISSVLNDI